MSHLGYKVHNATQRRNATGDNHGKGDGVVKVATGDVTDGKCQNEDGEAKRQRNADLRCALPTAQARQYGYKRARAMRMKRGAYGGNEVNGVHRRPNRNKEEEEASQELRSSGANERANGLLFLHNPRQPRETCEKNELAT